jgi:uncharacterized membrane protein
MVIHTLRGKAQCGGNSDRQPQLHYSGHRGQRRDTLPPMLEGFILNIADWIQSLSLLLVAGALIASIFQTRAVAHQARQATTALQATTHQSFVHNQNGSREAFFLDRPELLSWHLSSRGYPETNAAENLRRLYVLNKLDIHEYNYLFVQGGTFQG